MANVSNPKADNPVGEPIPWAKFLESFPPGQLRAVAGVAQYVGMDNAKIVVPAIQLFCESEDCGGVRYFDGSSDREYLKESEWRHLFFSYTCRHCHRRNKIFALAIQHKAKTQGGNVIKFGEWPVFGPHIPTKMFSLLGDDQEIFKKGRRAESQGMGVGAFAYYRRVVENQKNRLIDEIIKVSKRLEAAPEMIAKLELARKETQFSKAVETIKEGIPDVLRINGHNPLTLLHTALSDGLHDQSDDECLVRATSIRLVMAQLAERITQVMQDHADLNQAVSQLLQIKTGTAKSKLEKPQ